MPSPLPITLDRDADGTSVLTNAIATANTLRTQVSDIVAALPRVARELRPLRPYLSEAAVYEADGDDQDLAVRPLLEQLLDECIEFRNLRGRPIAIDWFTRPRKSRGNPVLGRARSTSEKERALWSGDDVAPWFRIELSLAYWMLADEAQRLRLLHHELMHCDVEIVDNADDDDDALPFEKPVIRTHDVEEWIATVGRFGVASHEQASLVKHAVPHPGLKRWSFDDGGQGLMFHPWGEAEEPSKPRLVVDRKAAAAGDGR